MQEHTPPRSLQRPVPRLTRGVLLRQMSGGAGAALAATALLSIPTMSIAKAAVAAGRGYTMPAKPNVVLVHGAFADASSWSQVIQRLQAAGHPVSAVQLDLASLADDVARTRTVQRRTARPSWWAIPTGER
jgi:hypothetical protein